ncbi:MAG: hypothetical protein QNL88_15295, partial [Acidobacteriota bacterium]|nr:hypothetical protein [Acidobacteriota bacterium]
ERSNQLPVISTERSNPHPVISTERSNPHPVISTERSEWRNLLQGSAVTFSGVRVKPAFRSRFPRGATFSIVCPRRLMGLQKIEASNNAKNGTSAAREHLRFFRVGLTAALQGNASYRL